MVLARAFTLTMSQDRLYCSIALQYTYYNTIRSQVNDYFSGYATKTGNARVITCAET